MERGCTEEDEADGAADDGATSNGEYVQGDLASMEKCDGMAPMESGRLAEEESDQIAEQSKSLIKYMHRKIIFPPFSLLSLLFPSFPSFFPPLNIE